MTTNIRKKYGKRNPVLVNCETIGKTKPEFKESCDINHILNKYQKTGQLPIMQKTPLYEDFSSVPDYQGSLNIIIKAEEQFNNLPSDIRKKFENDPSKFLEFVDNKDNSEAMIKMGLKEAEFQPEIIPETTPEQAEEAS